MTTNERFDWSYLLLAPYLAVSNIPWLGYRIRTRYVFLVALVWVIVSLMRRRHVRLPKTGAYYLLGTFLFLLLYGGIGFLYLIFGHGEGISYDQITGLVTICLSLTVFHLSVCNGRLRELRLVVFFCLLCMVITAIMTFTGESVIEGGSKVLTGAGAESVDPTEIMAAMEAGIGSYGFIYGIGLLVFPILYCISYMRLMTKLLFVMLAMLFLLTVYKAGYAILLIGMLLACATYCIAMFHVRLAILRSFGFILVAAFVTVLANPTVLSFLRNPIQGLCDLTNSQEYQLRISSVADMVEGKTDTYAMFRSNLYWQSWETFLEYPLFGIGKYDFKSTELMYKIGGHSTIFDTLGSTGIFGLSMFLLFFVCHYRYMRVINSVALGDKWFPAYFLFIFPFLAIAFVNPLEGNIIFSDIVLFIPSMVVFFRSQRPALRSLGMNRYLFSNEYL